MTNDQPPALHIRQRDALLLEGVSDSAIRHATANGALHRIRRGAYVMSEEEWVVPPWDRHAVLVAATTPKLAPGAVISHQSAAALHGLAVWPLPPDRVHVSRGGPGSGGGRRTRTLHLHVGPLPGSDVTSVSGIAVTSIARTVIDLARAEPFEAAVVTADHALHTGVVDRTALAEVLERQRNRSGRRRAEAVIAFADGLTESVGESRSRVAMLRTGLPAPALQHRIYSHRGQFVGRADFAYVEQRIAGEFDGRTKYCVASAEAAEVVDILVAERQRADAMERAGWIVVRWMWDDISPAILASKWRAALALRTQTSA